MEQLIRWAMDEVNDLRAQQLEFAVAGRQKHSDMASACAEKMAEVLSRLQSTDFQLERDVAMWKKSADAKQRLLTKAESALRSIANSACCKSCQEARLVAQAALADAPECTCEIDAHNYHCPEHRQAL